MGGSVGAMRLKNSEDEVIEAVRKYVEGGAGLGPTEALGHPARGANPRVRC